MIVDKSHVPTFAVKIHLTVLQNECSYWPRKQGRPLRGIDPSHRRSGSLSPRLPLTNSNMGQEETAVTMAAFKQGRKVDALSPQRHRGHTNVEKLVY